MCGTPERMPAFGARTFPTVITTSVVQDLKGQSHEIFDPRFFSANITPGSLDSWAKAVLNINSYSRRYSIFKFDSAQCRKAQFLVSAIQKFFLLFCRQYVGKFTYG
jgi:hypothetical protein